MRNLALWMSQLRCWLAGWLNEYSIQISAVDLTSKRIIWLRKGLAVTTKAYQIATNIVRRETTQKVKF